MNGLSRAIEQAISTGDTHLASLSSSTPLSFIQFYKGCNDVNNILPFFTQQDFSVDSFNYSRHLDEKSLPFHTCTPQLALPEIWLTAVMTEYKQQ